MKATRDRDDDTRGGDDSNFETYEVPTLVVLGNLRDLLAGGGTKACDGSLPQPGDNNTLC